MRYKFLTVFDSEKSLDLPKEYLYKELLLHAAFGVCFTNRCIQIINQVPEKQAISKLVNNFAQEIMQSEAILMDHIP